MGDGHRQAIPPLPVEVRACAVVHPPLSRADCPLALPPSAVTRSPAILHHTLLPRQQARAGVVARVVHLRELGKTVWGLGETEGWRWSCRPESNAG